MEHDEFNICSTSANQYFLSRFRLLTISGGTVMEKIKLVDALANLRRELYEANEAAKNEGLKLEIDTIDVEFAVEIEKSAEASGQISGKAKFLNFFVIEGGVKAGGEVGSTRSHSIKLHLKPKLDNNTSFDVSGKSTIPND
jgi:hypothetical protein